MIDVTLLCVAIGFAVVCNCLGECSAIHNTYIYMKNLRMSPFTIEYNVCNVSGSMRICQLTHNIGIVVVQLYHCIVG